MPSIVVLLPCLLIIWGECGGTRVAADGLLGCNFKTELCGGDETCYDDGVFGQCGSGEGDWFFEDTPTASQYDLLNGDLESLVSDGHHWENPITQCTLLYYTLAFHYNWEDVRQHFCDVENPENMLATLQQVNGDLDSMLDPRDAYDVEYPTSEAEVAEGAPGVDYTSNYASGDDGEQEESQQPFRDQVSTYLDNLESQINSEPVEPISDEGEEIMPDEPTSAAEYYDTDENGIEPDIDEFDRVLLASDAFNQPDGFEDSLLGSQSGQDATDVGPELNLSQLEELEAQEPQSSDEDLMLEPENKRGETPIYDSSMPEEYDGSDVSEPVDYMNGPGDYPYENSVSAAENEAEAAKMASLLEEEKKIENLVQDYHLANMLMEEDADKEAAEAAVEAPRTYSDYVEDAAEPIYDSPNYDDMAPDYYNGDVETPVDSSPVDLDDADVNDYLNSLGAELEQHQIEQAPVDYSEPVFEEPAPLEAPEYPTDGDYEFDPGFDDQIMPPNVLVRRNYEEVPESSQEFLDADAPSFYDKKAEETLGIQDQGTGKEPLELVWRKPEHPMTPPVSYQMRDSLPVDAEDVFERDMRSSLEGPDDKRSAVEASEGLDDDSFAVITFVVCGAVGAMLVVLLGLYVVRARNQHVGALRTLGADPEASFGKNYEELCRQHANTGAKKQSIDQQISGFIGSIIGGKNDGVNAIPESPPNSAGPRDSSSSWSEEPVQSNLDISTGHMILSYMEEHMRNRAKFTEEWRNLSSYQPDGGSTVQANLPENQPKNRDPGKIPYDHSRVRLSVNASLDGTDYINASQITDHDPRNPSHIACQGPRGDTAADMWQMVWEQGAVVIVNLTKTAEDGMDKCYKYWPENGSDVYHGFEVHLVSEHIWCEDYLVRSFYLKNLTTNETRTVTQFHFLTWPDHGVPGGTKPILDFRRKVNKCYRGKSCPIVVHCSDGSGRCGTYTLLDMVLNRLNKGVKEIDIAATLEHLRDQRLGMVENKEQFEYVLMCVADEVQAILKALPQQA